MLNEQIAGLVTELATNQGRPHVLVGFADARDAFDSVDFAIPHQNAVSLAVALDAHAVSGVQDGPTPEYYEEVMASKEFVKSLERKVGAFLESEGYAAVRLADARHALIDEGMAREDAACLSHRVIAAHAGLGWIGKNNLLITKHFGPAVTLGGVLTDAPVECGKEVFLSRCGRCVECIVACPTAAINNAEWSGKISTAGLVDEEACAEACRAQSVERLGFEADVCGVCIWACPYARAYLSRNGLWGA